MSLTWRITAAIAGVSTAAAIATGVGMHQFVISATDRPDLADSGLAVRLILIDLIVICVAVLASVLLGHRLTRALRAASHAAREIVEGDLDVGGSVVSQHRRFAEVTDLSQALEIMAAELRAHRIAEQRFTSDVAHELRTPLTGLVTAAELLPPGRPTELVRDRVQKLRALVEDLLEISQLDALVETADLRGYSLAELVGRIVSAAMPQASLQVERDARVLTESRRLDRVLTNLLVNASRHGRPPVVVTVDGAVVTVRDHGAGFPADLLAHGPRRFRTARRERGEGHGLGLTIAAGHCRVLGVELRFANHQHGGALGIIDLSARSLD